MRRFAVYYVALGAVLLGGIAALVIAVVTPPVRPAPPWSNWAPPRGSTAKVENAIAAHVAGEYRLDNNGRLLDALIDVVPVGANGGPAVRVGSVAHLSKSAWIVELCGLGPRCSVAGVQSVKVRELEQREALEFALFTFKYTAISSVTTLLPPPIEPEAVRFQKADYANELTRPLDETLRIVEP